jgi:hypothetical protein
MVALMREFPTLASRPDRVLRPPQEDCDLRDVERSGPVLEHLWNTIWPWNPLGFWGRSLFAAKAKSIQLANSRHQR